ncbi:hypothetical protein N8I77_008341 [Diaporthe amygdali]|uniref:Carboxylic ester hydrolase n=1 Tax=Phomopsis amygdali TaxID=1214568 RepID=A0AAD9SET0_PHOAM|nr:hypothetical protein N8I77_008341 [Diaporthe amygdali]
MFASFPHYLLQLIWLVGAVSAVPFHTKSHSPTVTIKNGSVVGVYNPNYHQDLFLGIPFATPPVGQLRFARPQSLNQSWSEPRVAQQYGPFCFGVSVGLTGFDQKTISYDENEDCLTINVIRPSGMHYDESGLPVLAWIHGGGFQEGGSGDARYNMSYLVQTSTEISKPMIGVSFNYRVSSFGFASGRDFRDAGMTNIGLHDQRLALQWIQENIESFGGDPRRVTIHGESAGALSVGYHLLADGGDPKGLFSAAIAESGGPFFARMVADETAQDSELDKLLQDTGCPGSSNVISCLRDVPADTLKAASANSSWYPIIDNNLWTDLSSVALGKGAFAKVPLLIGTNTNEGTPFVPLFSSIGANSSADFAAAVKTFHAPFNISDETVNRLDQFYDAAVADDSGAELGTVLPDPSYPYGSAYGKVSLLLGDLLFIAGRRITAESWAAHNATVYSYRFDTVPADLDPLTLGAAHFQEVAFVFGDTSGLGFESNPFSVSSLALRNKYVNMSKMMGRMWVNFVNDGNPNEGETIYLSCNTSSPVTNTNTDSKFETEWPSYTASDPVNFVFNASRGMTLEADDFRKEAIDLIHEMAPDVGR